MSTKQPCSPLDAVSIHSWNLAGNIAASKTATEDELRSTLDVWGLKMIRNVPSVKSYHVKKRCCMLYCWPKYEHDTGGITQAGHVRTSNHEEKCTVMLQKGKALHTCAIDGQDYEIQHQWANPLQKASIKYTITRYSSTYVAFSDLSMFYF